MESDTGDITTITSTYTVDTLKISTTAGVSPGRYIVTYTAQMSDGTRPSTVVTIWITAGSSACPGAEGNIIPNTGYSKTNRKIKVFSGLTYTFEVIR